MPDIEEFEKKKKKKPEIRASVIYCSTPSIVLGPGDKLFYIQCQDFPTNIFMAFESKCIMCLGKPCWQQDPAQQKESSQAGLWLFPEQICSSLTRELLGGQGAQNHSITSYSIQQGS